MLEFLAMHAGGGADSHVWGSAPDFIGPRHELRERVMLERFLAAQPGHRVLNVGAGQGTFTNTLLREGFDVTSTDLSEAAVDVLRARVGGRVEAADATELPFEDGTFDAVALGEVLEHIDDDAAAVREAHRVLVDRGVLVASVPRNPAWFSQSDEWAGHFRRYTRQRLLLPLEDAGFDVLSCVAWGFPVSALYHRTAYERAVRRRDVDADAPGRRRSLAVLRALLMVDRLFIGWERGALGYVVVARRGA